MLSCFSYVQLFATLWTIARQAPLSMGFSNTRILDWVAVPSSRGSSQPRDRTHVSKVWEYISLKYGNAAAAKSLQLYPTLCQERVLEWGTIAFSEVRE